MTVLTVLFKIKLILLRSLNNNLKQNDFKSTFLNSKNKIDF